MNIMRDICRGSRGMRIAAASAACAAWMFSSRGAVIAQSADVSGSAPAVVRTVEGELSAARVVSFDPRSGATVALGDGTRRSIATSDVVSIEFGAGGGREHARGWRIRLQNGDEVCGWLTEAVEQSILLDTRDLGPIRIPVEAIGLILTPAATEGAMSERVAALERSEATDDVVLLSNGDSVSGFMSRLDHEALVLDGPAGPQRIAKDVFLAIRLAGERPSPVPRPHFRAELRASGRLTLETFLLEQGAARGLTTFGEEVRFDAGRIASVSVVGGRWQPLDELEPISATHVPMLTLDRPHRRGSNVVGGALRVGGREYAQGIGVQSRSVLTFDLGGGVYESFVASFGIDDSAAPEGDVSVRIVVDGAVRYSQDHVRPGRLYGPVRVELRGARKAGGAEGASSESSPAAQLQLIVDFGDNGDIGDRLNWIEPALIRR
ncbi:MAG: hypothetical protein EDS66_01485 [Planctomycetota bacterium]|nr:MAG: hypothetical protein EDS66_01485 [Planctomycetota bacterium]KAB2945419.1 MAG: hypothetical protein F9K17_10025 [Phycisphaerae bacterium]MCQ3920549.1 hypothetical protein [Planctomycetota bacterium]